MFHYEIWEIMLLAVLVLLLCSVVYCKWDFELSCVKNLKSTARQIYKVALIQLYDQVTDISCIVIWFNLAINENSDNVEHIDIKGLLVNFFLGTSR